MQQGSITPPAGRIAPLVARGQKRSKRAQKITPEELEEVGYSDEWLESLSLVLPLVTAPKP